MKNIFAKLLFSQQGKIGYEIFFFLLALGFVVLFFWPALKYSPISKEAMASPECAKKEPNIVMVLPQGTGFPDPELPIQDPNGISFERIMAPTPIVQVQVATHFNNLGKVNYRGKNRTVYSAWFNLANKQIGPDGRGQHVSAVNFTSADGIENLLFVDMTEDQDPRQEGMIYVEIYLKKGQEIPNFVNQYCESATLFANVYSGFSFMKDQDGNSIPPLKFNTKDLQNKTTGRKCETSEKGMCAFADDEEFYLFGYAPRLFQYGIGASVYEETMSKPPYFVKRTEGCGSQGCDNLWSQGDLIYTYNGQQKNFRFEWYSPASSMWGGLFDRDAAGPLGQVMFYYAPKRFLGPPVISGPDLANALPDDWNNKTLQLRAIDAKTIPSWGWWTPECKPAIYLYPKSAMNVNVKVHPQGLFKYTDPVYNRESGWNVKAYPTGKLEWLDSSFGIDSKGTVRDSVFYKYLYYESKIPDSSITKPSEGFLVKYEELEEFYRDTLPLLGLHEAEIADYIEFWQKALPKNDYYFIGIVDPLLVNVLEPLTITPTPDEVLRVRFYYEGLSTASAQEKQKTLNPPKNLNTYFNRTGFSVVEWGGFVKQDKNHPFTCSM